MINTSLQFDPTSDITFHEDRSTVLSVINTTDQTMVCKIETPEYDCYEIDPLYFFLSSLKTIFVNIELKEHVGEQELIDHELNVKWFTIEDIYLEDDAETYWEKNYRKRRQDSTTKFFGCKLEIQQSVSIPIVEINPSANQTFQPTEIDKNIRLLGKIAMDSHTTVSELNSEFDALIKRMDGAGVEQLSDIITELRKISVDYRDLEHKTHTAVTRTTDVVSEVARIASSKKLKPDEKITLIKRDFASLSKEFDTLSRRHTGISKKLATQAEKAEAAKEENDLRVKKAEEMREDAQICGVMGTPVIGLATTIANCSKMAVDSVDNSALKVVAGVGGALGGIVVGTIVTAGSPILLAIAAGLAVTSKLWSTTFENMHDMIRHVEKMIDQAAGHLSDISSNLNALDEKAKQLDPNESQRMLNEEFRRIQRMCESVSKICKKYEQLADARRKRIK